MENNIENKARFFALYYRQSVLRFYEWDSTQANSVLDDVGPYTKDFYLELKPLSSITDEDVIEAFTLISDEHYKSRIKDTEDKKYLINTFIANDLGFWSFQDAIRITDYLRSKGYALPFMGLSVEQLIEYGWIKLADTLIVNFESAVLLKKASFNENCQAYYEENEVLIKVDSKHITNKKITENQYAAPKITSAIQWCKDMGYKQKIGVGDIGLYKGGMAYKDLVADYPWPDLSLEQLTDTTFDLAFIQACCKHKIQTLN